MLKKQDLFSLMRIKELINKKLLFKLYQVQAKIYQSDLEMSINLEINALISVIVNILLSKNPWTQIQVYMSLFILQGIINHIMM